MSIETSLISSRQVQSLGEQKTVPNRFFAFDGPNGSGKSSLIEAVAKRLRSKNYTVYSTKEPTAAPLGVFIREAQATYSGLALAHLVCADRIWHIENEVLPALRRGEIVLSDRYVASSLALQWLDGVDMNAIWQFNHSFLSPVLYLMVMPSPQVLESRLALRAELTRFEKDWTRADELNAFQEAVSFLRSRGQRVEIFHNEEPVEISASVIADAISSEIV